MNHYFSLFVVAIALVIVVVAYFLAVKNTLWPGEDEPDHIKYSVLEEDQ